MIVNSLYLPIIRKLAKNRNGILLTSELVKNGIPRTYLSILEAKEEIEHIARGVYLLKDSMPDEMFCLQAIYKHAIFSHETALYLLDLSDRTPLEYSMTVPSGYNATSLKNAGVKVYFIQKDMIPLGRIMKKSPNGNNIKTYDLERTICDVVRSRNQIDITYFNEALKKYVKKKEKKLDLLYTYAKQFRIQNILRTYIEILL